MRNALYGEGQLAGIVRAKSRALWGGFGWRPDTMGSFCQTYLKVAFLEFSIWRKPRQHSYRAPPAGQRPALVALQRGELIQSHALQRRRARPANPRDQRTAFGDDEGLVVRQQILRIADQGGDAPRVAAGIPRTGRAARPWRSALRLARVLPRQGSRPGTARRIRPVGDAPRPQACGLRRHVVLGCRARCHVVSLMAAGRVIRRLRHGRSPPLARFKRQAVFRRGAHPCRAKPLPYFFAFSILVTVNCPLMRSGTNLTLSPALTAFSIAGSPARKTMVMPSSMSNFFSGPCLIVILPRRRIDLGDLTVDQIALARWPAAAQAPQRVQVTAAAEHVRHFMSAFLSALSITSR